MGECCSKYRLQFSCACKLKQIMINVYTFCHTILKACKKQQRRRDSDWLRPGRPRSRSSSPGRDKNFHFFISSRPTLRFTQPSIQWIPGALSPGVKRLVHEADHLPPTSAEVKKNVDVYIHSPIRLHCVVLN
jgi:hypothetical protein